MMEKKRVVLAMRHEHMSVLSEEYRNRVPHVDISIYILVIDTSVLAKSNMDQRKYIF
jgi:hypothetical protein